MRADVKFNAGMLTPADAFRGTLFVAFACLCAWVVIGMVAG